MPAVIANDEILWTGNPRASNTGTDSLTTTDINIFSAFAKATGWQVLFGLNLGNYNPLTAASEASYISNSLQNSLYVFQTGNEPDLFSGNGLRPLSYTYPGYQSDWNNYFTSVRNTVSNARFAGPDAAGDKPWITSFAANEYQNIKLVDGHYYSTGPATDTSITYKTILATDTKLPAYLHAVP